MMSKISHLNDFSGFSTLRRLSLSLLVAVMIASGFAAQRAQAQSQAATQGADAGLVNQVGGDVMFQGETGSASKALAYMKVRQGDRFTLPAGATVRLTWFAGGRQETWKGPASFRVGAALGERLTGTAPEVAILPATVPQKMAKIPDLMQSARLGGVTVRGGMARPASSLSPSAKAEIQAAQDNYRQMRAQSDEGDVTPELFLLSVLQDHGQFDEMRATIDEMKRRAPGNADVLKVAGWLESRMSK